MQHLIIGFLSEMMASRALHAIGDLNE